METAERRVLAALWSLPGVGRKTLTHLATHGPLAQWLSVTVEHLLPLAGWKKQARASLRTIRTLADVADRLERTAKRLGHELAFAGDAKYPERLTELADAPPVLFVVGPGASATPRRRLAMVGTRRPDHGFLERARAFAEATAAAGVGIVSGGAEGVDQACHGAALRARGETWAFLGCAIEQIDPAQQVLVTPFRDFGGTLFSEFPPGARPARSTFPRRNRLISGSADAVLVLRAPVGSGALHTARYAALQGRPVLALPGDSFNEAAAGCNRLIRDKLASICLDVGDVLRVVGGSSVPSGVHQVNFEAGELSDLAARVLTQVSRTPVDFDVLLGKTQCGSGELSGALLELELANRVVKRAGQRYEKV